MTANTTRIDGTPDNDILIGTNGSDLIYGFDGNDIIEGKEGADLIDGGRGVNTASYLTSKEGVRIDLGDMYSGRNIAKGGDAEGDRFNGIQNLIGSQNVDSLFGNIWESNTIEGKGGADIMGGRPANPFGQGSYTLSYLTSPAAVKVSLTTGRGTGGDAEGDSFSEFQNIIGSPFADTLVGDVYNNVINAGPGDDTIDGAGGTDQLYGEAGRDNFIIRNIPGTINIKDFNVTAHETIDMLAFDNVHSLADLKATDQQGDTSITLPSINIVLSNVVPSQLTDANFIFNPAPPEDVYWTTEQILTVGGAILGAVGTILAIVVRIHSCHKEKSFCFKDHMAAIAAPIVATMVDNGPQVVIEMTKHAVGEALGFHDNPLVGVGVNEQVGDNQL
jgi:hypothetical protein